MTQMLGTSCMVYLVRLGCFDCFPKLCELESVLGVSGLIVFLVESSGPTKWRTNLPKDDNGFVLPRGVVIPCMAAPFNARCLMQA